MSMRVFSVKRADIGDGSPSINGKDIFFAVFFGEMDADI